MPKVAGTTCLNIFEKIYANRILKDYDDKILSSSKFSHRKNAIFSMFNNGLSSSAYQKIDCIHGHFMPLKYRILDSNNIFFLTWLRNPVQRLISHYYYWSREPLPKNAGALRKTRRTRILCV